MAKTPVNYHILRNDRNTQIGNVCHQWAHLEFLLAIVIWKLLHIDEDTGRIVTGGLDILPRINMGIALAEHLKAPPVLKRSLKDTRTALQDGLLERRNRAIHGIRFINPADPYSSELFLMHRGKGAGVATTQTNKDLAQIGKDIVALHEPLLSAMTECGLLFASAPRPARIIARKAARKASPKESASRS
jgi:hypothetical protein